MILLNIVIYFHQYRSHTDNNFKRHSIMIFFDRVSIAKKSNDKTRFTKNKGRITIWQSFIKKRVVWCSISIKESITHQTFLFVLFTDYCFSHLKTAKTPWERDFTIWYSQKHILTCSIFIMVITLSWCERNNGNNCVTNFDRISFCEKSFSKL